MTTLRFATAWAVGLLTFGSQAAELPGPAPDETRRFVEVESQAEPREVGSMYRLTVDPARLGARPLRYRFRPDLSERTPGNAATHYYRAMLEFDEFEVSRGLARREGLPDEPFFSDWFSVPIPEFPTDAAARFFDSGNDRTLDMLLAASRCERCDWDLRLRDETSGVKTWDTLLTDTQKMRGFARLLRTAQRDAIARGDAVRFAELVGAQAALAEALFTRETVIDGLCGVAVLSIQRDVLFEAIAYLGETNWAACLTDLGPPAMPLARLVESELDMTMKLAPWARGAATRDLTDRQWIAAFDQTLRDIRHLSSREEVAGTLAAVESDETRRVMIADALRAGIDRIRDDLRDAGVPEAGLAGRPAGQLLAMRTERVFDEFRDASVYASSLPAGRTTEVDSRVDALLKPSDDDGLITIAETLMRWRVSGLAAWRHAAARNPVSYASLRVVEALRHHAAVAGRFPEFLDEVTELPVPPNPATGEPFPYRRDDRGVARLRVAWPGPNKGFDVELRLAETGPPPLRGE